MHCSQQIDIRVSVLEPGPHLNKRARRKGKCLSACCELLVSDTLSRKKTRTSRDFSCVDLVALVPHQHDRYCVRLLILYSTEEGRAASAHLRWIRVLSGGYIRDLLSKALHPLECGTICDAIDEQEAFSLPDPLIPQRRILFLSCGIEHFQHARLIIDHCLLSVAVLDRGIVRL